MMRRTALSTLRDRLTALRGLATDAAPAAAAGASSVKLNFCLPHKSIYNGASVASVIIPGSAGEYGVTANHVPYVAQLKPGVVQILHDEGSTEPEKYFVAGGYAMTHEDSSTDVICPEAVKLDDIDSAVVTKNFDKAKKSFESASSGSVEQAEAQIDMEVLKAMGLAVGVQLG